MLKPNSSFKMSRAGKTYLAMTWNRPLKNQRKRSVIESEIMSRMTVKSRRDSKEEN